MPFTTYYKYLDKPNFKRSYVFVAQFGVARVCNDIYINIQLVQTIENSILNKNWYSIMDPYVVYYDVRLRMNVPIYIMRIYGSFDQSFK